MWFTENGVKHVNTGTLRTITNITETENNFNGKLKKRIPEKRNSFTGVFQRFCS